MANKWKESPHMVRQCQLMRQIHEEQLWDAPDEIADPVYDECDFHWDFLAEEERMALWEFSRLLYAASGEADPEWKLKTDFISYCEKWYEMVKKQEAGLEETTEYDSLLDQMDEPRYKLSEEERGLLGLFGSLLNLTKKEKKNDQCNV